jgi:hypothetical protein
VLPSCWFGSYVLGSIRPFFFLLPRRQGKKKKKLGVPIYKKKLNRQNKLPYKLAIGRMNESSRTMALPPGQKMEPGAVAPLYICSTASSGCRLLLKL